MTYVLLCLFQTDEMKTDYQQLQREVQSLQESCHELQSKNDKFQHDQSAKENQIKFLQVLEII